MSFWTWLLGETPNHAGVTPNANGPQSYSPGDPDGFEYAATPPTEDRALPVLAASAWDGWPSGWDTPDWQKQVGLNRLVDVAWTCLDLNSNVISSMPVYRLQDNRIIEPVPWMNNPDPTIYSSWQEFLKQLMWDFMMGEAFVMPVVTDYLDRPTRFRVIPPPFVDAELVEGRRTYKIGTLDVTDQILHIRYQSTTTEARGRGPLEAAGARVTAIKLLQRYANNLAETGGVPLYWMNLDRRITPTEGRDIIDRWLESRAANPAAPALVANGAELNQANSMSARDMSLLELQQFNESRIAVMHGVPPFLVGLAGAAGSLTYSNISDLFDFHDRSSLRPKVRMVMEALSNWALPRGQSAELNRDDYTRLPFDQRMAAYKTAIELGILTVEEVRIMERFYGTSAAQALTGGNQ
jgi:HK97 family phage portal protein